MTFQAVRSGAISAEDAAAWRSERVAVNLERLRWFNLILIGITLSMVAILFLVPALRTGSYPTRIFFDLGFVSLMTAIGEWVRQRPGSSIWRPTYVKVAIVSVLMGLDSWFFQAMPEFGPNSDYVLGVIITGAVFLVPPRPFTAILIVNHLAFCTLLFMGKQPASVLVPVIVDGTAGVIVACLIAWFLHEARQAEYFKARALAASNADLREVMAIAAHDLRSPLLALRDLLIIASRRKEAVGMVARILNQGVETCSAMTQMIKRLLEAHSAEEESACLVLVPHDLRERCNAVVDRLRPTAAKKRQTILVDLPAIPALAPVQTIAFDQIVENLLSNALKFSPEGAPVELALRPSPDGNSWRIDMRDEGPGIPDEEIARLFQKFHRGSAMPTGGEHSTGLGLFIVKTLVEAMGGKVGYAPGKAKGAVFAVELPRWEKA